MLKRYTGYIYTWFKYNTEDFFCMSNTFGWPTAGIPCPTSVLRRLGVWSREQNHTEHIQVTGSSTIPSHVTQGYPGFLQTRRTTFSKEERGFGIFHSGVHCWVSHLPGVDLYSVPGGRWIGSRKMWKEEVLLELFWAHSTDTVFRKLGNQFEWRDLEMYFNRNKGLIVYYLFLSPIKLNGNVMNT